MRRILTAKEYFDDKAKVRAVQRTIPTVSRAMKTEHLDYMEFAEDYADYVANFEKDADRMEQARK